MANYSVVPGRRGYIGRESRQSSQFSYKTPSFGGFSAEAAFVTKGDHGNNAKYDLNLIYADGPISAALAYNKVQKNKANYALGGKYDFGGFAISAAYYDIRHLPTANIPAGATLKSTGISLGGSANFNNITLSIELHRQHKSKYALRGQTYKFKKNRWHHRSKIRPVKKNILVCRLCSRLWRKQLRHRHAT